LGGGEGGGFHSFHYLLAFGGGRNRDSNLRKEARLISRQTKNREEIGLQEGDEEGNGDDGMKILILSGVGRDGQNRLVEGKKNRLKKNRGKAEERDEVRKQLTNIMRE